MTASLDSEAEGRNALHLPVSSQKSVNFGPEGYALIKSLSFFVRFSFICYLAPPRQVGGRDPRDALARPAPLRRPPPLAPRQRARGRS
jgi:hypothetical protein